MTRCKNSLWSSQKSKKRETFATNRGSLARWWAFHKGSVKALRSASSFAPPPLPERWCAWRWKRKGHWDLLETPSSADVGQHCCIYIPRYCPWRFLGVNCQVLIAENLSALGFWLGSDFVTVVTQAWLRILAIICLTRGRQKEKKSLFPIPWTHWR